MNDSSKAQHFVERIVAPNVKAFVDATRNADLTKRSKDLEASAQKLATGLTLLGGIPGTEGTALMAQLRVVSLMCTLLSNTQKHVNEAGRGCGPFTVNNDLGHWCGDLHAALSSLSEVRRAEADGLPSTVRGLLDRLSNLGMLAIADCLLARIAHQDRQITQQLEEHAAASSVQHRILDRTPTAQAALRALEQTGPVRSRVVKLWKEGDDVAELVDEVLTPLTGSHAEGATRQRILKTFRLSDELRRDGPDFGLIVHQNALDFVSKAVVASQDPVLKELAATAKRSGVFLDGLVGLLRDASLESQAFTPRVAQGVGEHVVLRGGEIAADARHLSSKLPDGFALRKDSVEALKGVAEAADASAMVTRFTLQQNRPSDNALSVAEQRSLDRLIETHFKLPARSPQQIALPPVADLAAPSSSVFATAQQPAPSLDWIDVPAPAAPQQAASSRRKGGLKQKPAPRPASQTAGPEALRRARESFELAATFGSISAGTQSRARWLVTQARNEVASPGASPMSAWRVGRYVEDAADTLARGRAMISEGLAALDAATKTVEEIDPDAATTRELGTRRADLEENAKAEIGTLQREEQALRGEAVALQRGQSVNVFLSYPTLEGYRALAEDSNVSVTAQQVAQRSLLPESTVSGFRKPNTDYLDVYRLDLRTRQDESASWGHAGHVEFHAHFAADDHSADPQAGHFKNAAQATEGGSGVYRGRVDKYKLRSVVDELKARMPSTRSE